MLAIVIPCRNEARYIEKLLSALSAQTYREFQVIVVDGGSTDETRAIIQGYATTHPDLPIQILLNSRRTIPSSLNLAIASVEAEVILRLDAHCVPRADYVANCLRALKESGAQVVGGAWDVKAGDESAQAAAIAAAVSSPLGAGDAAYRLPKAPAGEVDTVPFGCFYRQVWGEVGGYDETLLTNEDYDFYVRVRARGGKVFFDPRIRCIYFARPNLKSLAQQYGRYGWWKAHALWRQPRALRWRQLIPLVWSGMAIIILFYPALWFVWLGYVGVLVGGAWRVARKNFWLTALAYLVIHFAWGWGAWGGLCYNLIRNVRGVAQPG